MRQRSLKRVGRTAARNTAEAVAWTLGGLVAGTLGGFAFGVLCGVLAWLTFQDRTYVVSLGNHGALSGASAGALIGAFGWIIDGRRSHREDEPTGVHITVVRMSVPEYSEDVPESLAVRSGMRVWETRERHDERS